MRCGRVVRLSGYRLFDFFQGPYQVLHRRRMGGMHEQWSGKFTSRLYMLMNECAHGLAARRRRKVAQGRRGPRLVINALLTILGHPSLRVSGHCVREPKSRNRFVPVTAFGFPI
jgi:hypothetical protein